MSTLSRLVGMGERRRSKGIRRAERKERRHCQQKPDVGSGSTDSQAGHQTTIPHSTSALTALGTGSKEPLTMTGYGKSPSVSRRVLRRSIGM